MDAIEPDQDPAFDQDPALDQESGHEAEPDEALLRLSGIAKRYGGVHALRRVDFDVRGGEVHALVGENGAGKSTLIKIISGAERADAGSVVVDGLPLAGGSTQAAIRAGVATVYQEPHLFGELTVAENVFLGREIRRGDASPRGADHWGRRRGRIGRVDWPTQRHRVTELLRQLGVDPAIAGVRVADLPVAEQQLVSIAKAFAHDARILILDEPSAIVTGREIDVLFDVVRNLRDAGMGIIYISHRLDELSRISDRVTVLRDGRVVASRSTEDLAVRVVAELMVGHELATVPDVEDEETAQEDAGQDGGTEDGEQSAASAPVLRVRALGRAGRFEGVDLSVAAGEIVALYGLVGSGTGDIARSLFGVDPADEGEVAVAGRVVRLKSPRAAARAGIAMLPGNRSVQGMFASKSIAFNLSSAHLRHLSRLPGWLDRGRENRVARELIDRLRIRARGPQTPVAALSGGNQQKTLIARQLVRSPQVLLLEEPTQGVDVGAKEEIYAIVAELAAAGMATVVVSSDLLEVLRLAARILVVRQGRIVAEFARGARQADVLAAAVGAFTESHAQRGHLPSVDA
ncbi:sugar ABC transporter ATP-binding protein [Actinopolymorpha sp. B17G11]|uniref:sugar ABC transporter ATP-binding protein n=1 Tax=Actinopolymorpha sp. B17G11 TaxID=3160861 RepID=UPI0032E4CB73